jgi:hypothetical protein
MEYAINSILLSPLSVCELSLSINPAFTGA